MYSWFCWMGKRLRLAIYFVVALVATMLATFPEAWRFHNGRWVMVQATRAIDSTRIWQDGAAHSLMTWAAVLLFIAMDLGSLGIGEHVNTPQPLQFLLTRPQRRTYFLWSAWVQGLIQLFVIFAVSFLASIGILGYAAGTFHPTGFLLSAMLIFMTVVAVHALVYSISMISGSGFRGYQAVALVGVIFVGAHIRQYPDYGWLTWIERWHIESLWDWTAAPMQSWLTICVSAVACVLLLPAAQRILARKEF